MRLQKYMAEAGVASRRACEELIRQGRVKVNGCTASVGMSVENGDTVEVDGKTVSYIEEKVILMLNKPLGVICTMEDPQGRKTIAEVFKDIPYRVYNVGRLDINSEGLLLVTNDGDLAYRLMHPKYMINKTYFVVCDGQVSPSEREHLQKGVLLEDGMTAPARVEKVNYNPETGRSSLYITIHEGKNRQVRRMLAAIGHNTLRLKRVGFGGLTLGKLRPGEWRKLTDDEIYMLNKAVGEIK